MKPALESERVPGNDLSAEHDLWFRHEVEKAIVEADSPGAEWDSLEEVQSLSLKKRAEWRSRADLLIGEKATA